jgi:hypothetical protein
MLFGGFGLLYGVPMFQDGISRAMRALIRIIGPLLKSIAKALEGLIEDGAAPETVTASAPLESGSVELRYLL